MILSGRRRRSWGNRRVDVGVEVRVEWLTKSFGSQNIWCDVTLTLLPGEISVLLGPSGTCNSVIF